MPQAPFQQPLLQQQFAQLSVAPQLGGFQGQPAVAPPTIQGVGANITAPVPGLTTAVGSEDTTSLQQSETSTVVREKQKKATSVSSAGQILISLKLAR